MQAWLNKKQTYIGFSISGPCAAVGPRSCQLSSYSCSWRRAEGPPVSRAAWSFPFGCAPRWARLAPWRGRGVSQRGHLLFEFGGLMVSSKPSKPNPQLFSPRRCLLLSLRGDLPLNGCPGLADWPRPRALPRPAAAAMDFPACLTRNITEFFRKLSQASERLGTLEIKYIRYLNTFYESVD